jgi:flagellar M-ring protein FliF
MSVLYSDLDQQDSGKIVQELESKKIPYELLADGSMIKVPSDQVLRLRVSMAQDGLPSHGGVVGYEIFNNEEALGTTNFLQNVKMVRALEGELSRTIGSFEQVERARVHLVIPQREVFSREKYEPKASVVLKLRAHKSLNNYEIDAMAHLVATAVPGLEVKNVTIVDTKGKPFKLGAQDPSTEVFGGSSTAQEYQSIYEQKLRKEIETLLERSLGAGKVKAQVSVDMNFDRIVTNSEVYDPDGAVVRSVQSISENERTPIGGESSDVSVANNVPGLGPDNQDGGQGNVATIERTDETTNYEISKTIKNQISESGEIKRLSVAILVDGSYKEENGVSSYVPRTQDEIKKIENLVKVAVGYSEDRGDKIEVINMPFTDEIDTTEEKPDWLRDELPSIAQTLIVAIVVVLVFVMVVRPIAIRIFNVKKPEITGATSSSINSGTQEQIDEVDIVPVMGNPNSQKIADTVQTYPQETLMVLRKWMNEGNS